MNSIVARQSHIRNPRSFFVGGEWVAPSLQSAIDVVDSATEDVFLTVAEA